MPSGRLAALAGMVSRIAACVREPLSVTILVLPLRLLAPGFGVLALAASLSASAQQAAERDSVLFPVPRPPELPSLRAHRLRAEAAGTIRLDGRLTEPDWQEARFATGLRQREPDEGSPATEDTEVRVLYDGHALYVGVRARDREPDKVIARILQRNRLMRGGFGLRFSGDDGIALLFDPFHDHRNAVVFATNPNGAKFDALVTDEGREVNTDWRGVWRVAATRTEGGWSAEFEIPFRTLRFPSGSAGEPWGFNIFRMIRRKNEEVLWSAWSRNNEGFTRVSRAGHLEGLTELPRSSLNLEVKPFLLSGGTQELAELEGGAGTAAPEGGMGPPRNTDAELDIGLDVKYEIQPGLVLDATVNPDFAQVEVDDEQVNLTRFSLFFPEKRDFFLENAGIFEFGRRGFGEPPPFLLFFSRRIGIFDGNEVPLLGGTRLTGRVGKQTVGFLDAVTDDAQGQPVTNYGVLRVNRDVGDRSVVGAMVADMRRADGESNTVGGVDFSLWPTRTINLRGFLAGTTTSGSGGDDLAYMVNLDFTGDHLGYFLQHLFIGPDASAEMGFITRTDIRRTDGFLRLTGRPPTLGLRKIDFRFQGQHIVRSDGLLQDWSVEGDVNPEWDSGERLQLSGQRGFIRLDEGFDLTDEVFVPGGDYDTWRFRAEGSTSSNRALSLRANASVERFFGGTLRRLSGRLRLSPGSHANLTVEQTHNDVEVPGGEFTADVTSVRFGYAFSTTLTANALVQYNSLDKRISTNVRFNLIHRPGSDLFLVFNEERGSDDSPWDFRSRGLVAKLTYLARI
ncbi:MAG: DUF5916 domain-containing protein [Gemmatimonadota bacterium]